MEGKVDISPSDLGCCLYTVLKLHGFREIPTTSHTRSSSTMTESLQDEKQGVTETTHIQNALPVMSEGNELVDNAAKEQIQNMDVEDRAMALERALQADPGIPEWSWRMVKFNLICILACVLGSDGGS